MKHSVAIHHLKQIERMKNLDKWVPHELTKNKNKNKNKNYPFEVLSSLILCNNFSIRL